jgi:drug/metabolite transporter (DMT)-like permease
VGLFLRTFICLLSLATFYLVIFAIQAAQANLAVIASMFSMAAFFTAFVFRVFFNERLLTKHYIGMTMLTIAIAVISQGKQPDYVDGEKEQRASIWFPISMVVLNSIVHTSITT